SRVRMGVDSIPPSSDTGLPRLPCVRQVAANSALPAIQVLAILPYRHYSDLNRWCPLESARASTRPESRDARTGDGPTLLPYPSNAQERTRLLDRRADDRTDDHRRDRGDRHPDAPQVRQAN